MDLQAKNDKRYKISDRALAILCRIKQCSDGPGEYWSPTLDYISNGDWCEEFHVNLTISGSGDAKIIESLRNKRLIEEAKMSSGSHGALNKYASRILEDGIVAIEKARESGQLEKAVDDAARTKVTADSISARRASPIFIS